MRGSREKWRRSWGIRLNKEKGGIYSVGFSPLFGKEGKGRFLNRMTRE